MRFKIDWANRIVGSKFTVLALFYFVFEGNFPSTSPQGAYIWRGLNMEGLIFGILRYIYCTHIYRVTPARFKVTRFGIFLVNHITNRAGARFSKVR